MMPQFVSGVKVAPSTISGLKAWWDADVNVFSDSGSTPSTQGGAVQQWNDLSGNGNHLIQTTAGSQPTWQKRGGKNVVRFAGTDDVLTVAHNSTLNFGTLYSIFMMFTVSVAFTDYTLLTKGANAYQMRAAGSGRPQAWKDGVGSILTTTSAFMDANAFYKYTVRMDANPTATYYFDQTDVSGARNVFDCADNTVDLRVGAAAASEWFIGDLRAICMYNTYITAQNIKDLVAYYT